MRVASLILVLTVCIRQGRDNERHPIHLHKRLNEAQPLRIRTTPCFVLCGVSNWRFIQFKMAIEILKWEDKQWHEIPKQDNPAFDYKYNDARLQERIIGRHNHCLIICKVEDYESKSVGKNGYVVIEVPSEPKDVIRRGLFWHIEHAEQFAEEFSYACC